MTVAPPACPAEAQAAVPDAPRLPDGAGLIAPSTDAERAMVGAYLAWLPLYGRDNDEKTRRLIAVKKWCDARDK